MEERAPRVAAADGANASQPPAPVRARGLEGVIALDSSICYIDGQAGLLIYRGYDIHDLAQNTTFEEVAYLLWNGNLPDQQELDALNEQLRAEREVPPAIIDMLRLMPSDSNPMAVLRTAVSALSCFDPEAEDMSREANYRKSIRLTARMPTLLAAFDRLRKGKEPVAPSKKHSLAFDFLYMLNGEEPGEQAERTLDVCLTLHAEHGLNASTFAARVAGSTLADIYSSITAAIGALKGPLHGGANIEVMKMLLDLDASGRDPVEYIRAKLERKERVMGFGHRVYKTIDPRAASLREMLHHLSEEKGDTKWLDLDLKIMETVKNEKNIDPNVDFFSAAVYYMLGIDIDLYTPLFAISRITGWTAHLLEQWEENRLIRPRSEYVGHRGLQVEPISDR